MAVETTPITEKYVELSHGKTRYFEAGSGYPTVLVHGAGFVGAADGFRAVQAVAAEKPPGFANDAPDLGPRGVFGQGVSFGLLGGPLRRFMGGLGLGEIHPRRPPKGSLVPHPFAYESPERL